MSSWGTAAKGLWDSPFPLEDEKQLGERVGGGEGRNNLPPCEICQKGIPGSNLTRDLSLSLGGLSRWKQSLMASFYALSPIPPGSCFLITVKWGSSGAVSKRASYFHWGYMLPHETHSEMLLLAYLASLSLFFFFPLSYKPTLTPSREPWFENPF